MILHSFPTLNEASILERSLRETWQGELDRMNKWNVEDRLESLEESWQMGNKIILDLNLLLGVFQVQMAIISGDHR